MAQLGTRDVPSRIGLAGVFALLCSTVVGCGGSTKHELDELSGGSATTIARGGGSSSGATGGAGLGGAKPTGTGGTSVKGEAGGATSVTTHTSVGTGTGGVVSSGGATSSIATGGKVSGGAGSGGKASAGAGAGGIGAAVNSVGGLTGTSGATGQAICAAYKAAIATADGLLEACTIASNGWCKATLQEFISAQVSATTTALTTKLVEGCGTQSVGWDARLGGKVLTFDASGNLTGYRFWDDVPNGPCGNTSGSSGAPTFSYSMGSSRSSLLSASASCPSDVVCSVTVSNANQVHCPIL